MTTTTDHHHDSDDRHDLKIFKEGAENDLQI